MTDRYLYGKQVTAQTIAKLVSRGATDKFKLLSAIVKTLPQGCKMPVVGTVANWARRACDEGAIAIDRIGTPAGKRAICDDDRIARLVYRPIGSDEVCTREDAIERATADAKALDRQVRVYGLVLIGTVEIRPVFVKEGS